MRRANIRRMAWVRKTNLAKRRLRGQVELRQLAAIIAQAWRGRAILLTMVSQWHLETIALLRDDRNPMLPATTG